MMNDTHLNVGILLGTAAIVLWTVLFSKMDAKKKFQLALGIVLAGMALTEGTLTARVSAEHSDLGWGRSFAVHMFAAMVTAASAFKLEVETLEMFQAVIQRKGIAYILIQFIQVILFGLLTIVPIFFNWLSMGIILEDVRMISIVSWETRPEPDHVFVVTKIFVYVHLIGIFALNFTMIDGPLKAHFSPDVGVKSRANWDNVLNFLKKHLNVDKSLVEEFLEEHSYEKHILKSKITHYTRAFFDARDTLQKGEDSEGNPIAPGTSEWQKYEMKYHQSIAEVKNILGIT